MRQGSLLRAIIVFLFLIIIVHAHASTIEIMAYNVENLFDTEHDQGKNDWEFLPKNYPGKREQCMKISSSYYRQRCLESDWTPKKLRVKLNAIKKMVKDSRRRLPDILCLSEIENENVVSKLARVLGYKEYYVSESDDSRGIDLAVLFNSSSKLRHLKTWEHSPYFIEEGEKATRNLFENLFLVDGKHKLTIFVNHWPSQAAPATKRLKVANKLKAIIQDRLRDNPNNHIVALGDFNVVDSDYPHPFYDGLLKQKGLLYDIYRKGSSIPLGTYFYGRKMSWNRLDRFFMSRNLYKGDKFKVDRYSYQIWAPRFSTKNYRVTDEESPHYGTIIEGVPKRYNFQALSTLESGFSDHFPIVVTLKTQ